MATILLVEDQPDLATYEAPLLAEEGHHVIHCTGGASAPWGACPMLRGRPCGLADVADVIVISTPLYGPLFGRGYRGIHLLRAYRAHHVYGRKPMIVVAFGAPEYVAGRGSYQAFDKHADPALVVDAIARAARGETDATDRG